MLGCGSEEHRVGLLSQPGTWHPLDWWPNYQGGVYWASIIYNVSRWRGGRLAFHTKVKLDVSSMICHSTFLRSANHMETYPHQCVLFLYTEIIPVRTSLLVKCLSKRFRLNWTFMSKELLSRVSASLKRSNWRNRNAVIVVSQVSSDSSSVINVLIERWTVYTHEKIAIHIWLWGECSIQYNKSALWFKCLWISSATCQKSRSKIDLRPDGLFISLNCLSKTDSYNCVSLV